MNNKILQLEGTVKYLVDYIKDLKANNPSDSNCHLNHNNYSSNIISGLNNRSVFDSNSIKKEEFDSFGGNLNPNQTDKSLINNYSRKGNNGIWSDILQELKVQLLNKFHLI
jgi:hypothetical protein